MKKLSLMNTSSSKTISIHTQAWLRIAAAFQKAAVGAAFESSLPHAFGSCSKFKLVFHPKKELLLKKFGSAFHKKSSSSHDTNPKPCLFHQFRLKKKGTTPILHHLRQFSSIATCNLLAHLFFCQCCWHFLWACLLVNYYRQSLVQLANAR